MLEQVPSRAHTTMVERPDPLLTRILAYETPPSNEQIMSNEGAVCASISPLAKLQPGPT